MWSRNGRENRDSTQMRPVVEDPSVRIDEHCMFSSMRGLQGIPALTSKEIQFHVHDRIAGINTGGNNYYHNTRPNTPRSLSDRHHLYNPP
jgi:hypothetical protein